MRISKRLVLLCLGVMLLAGAAAQASYYSYRQYYSGWNRHSAKRYYYRSYYYKPTPRYTGYKTHYCIYYPSRPKYVYFYNPYKRKYWGRCPLQHQGREDSYQLLEPEDRKGDIEEIPEEAFPPPKKNPPIPESTDGVTLDLPPDEPPPETAALPIG